MIAFGLLMVMMAANINPLFANSNTIYIDSLEDWVKFSKDASLDTYFQGKTVVLRKNIELSGVEDCQIPTFGGTFDGKGHALSGVSIIKSGSNQGLFRYLQEGASIKNLNVSGKVAPIGSKSAVGGLVGNNKGNIEDCHFSGSVKGATNIGGLVGINEATGTISHSTVKGDVTGSHFTGGIVGQNLGTILKSTNTAAVNTTIADNTVSVDRVNWAKINSTENISAHTDTGGITGYSSGYIQDCINKGPVGYTYMGYNVGGVVGRQSGYLKNCQNYHTVLGRKDVGGIVGQIEPHLILLFSEDTLQKLNKELTALQNILSNSFGHAGDTSSAISSGMSGIGETIDQSRDITQTLAKGTADHIDGVTDTVNISSRRVRYTLEELMPILDEGKEVTRILSQGMEQIELGFNDLEITSDKMADALDEGQRAMKSLRQAIQSGEDAVYQTERALKNLVAIIEKQENITGIANEIEGGIGSMGNSIKDGSQAIKDIAQAFKNLDELDPGFTNIGAELADLSGALDAISGSISGMGTNISHMIDRGISDFSSHAKRDLDGIFFDLNRASRRFAQTTNNLQSMFEKLADTSDASGYAFSQFGQGFSDFSGASDQMTTMTQSTRDLIDSLVEQPAIELPNISSEYRQSGEDLFASLGHMSDQVKDLREEISTAKDNLISDMEAANNQMVKIFNVLIDERQETGESGYIEDISDESTENQKQGVVYKNQNYGSVSGATNIGGIAGSMAVEYDIDPEDDVFKKGKTSLNFKYLTTAVVKECVNNGSITGKKDHTGGIVGRMDIGIITACENYGDIESKEGDYVGGIAGLAHKTIDQSFSLATLSGKDYVGGIAGYGNNISASYSLVDISKGTEYIGAIAGQVEGQLDGNHFVHDTLAAIDGISYSNQASPISYKQLLKVEGLPDAFSQFHITFIADGNMIRKVPFNYGDSFDQGLLPDIPAKDDHDSQWEEFNQTHMVFNQTVEAIYTPVRRVLASHLVSEGDQLPLLLVEGKFNGDVRLNLSPVEPQGHDQEISGNTILETWHVEIEGLEDEDINPTLRFLMPETKKGVKVWQQVDGEWKKLASTTHGRYMVFAISGNQGTFSISEKEFPWLPMTGAGLVVLAMTVIGGVALRKKSKAKVVLEEEENKTAV